jgi:septation ring formation regulator EzrA
MVKKLEKTIIIIHMTITEWLQTYIPLIVGVLTILTVGSALIYKLYKKFIKFIELEVREVAKEFKPNGGSSLKDQVNRLEKGHEKIDTEMIKVNEEIQSLKKYNQRLETKIDKMFDTLLKVISKFDN